MAPQSTSQPVSQKMIADHLQVSIATVSKALSNKPDISEAMRRKVEKAAKDLGYSYGKASQRQRVKKSSTKTTNRFIGVFLRRPLENGGKNTPTYMDGMTRVASEMNISLVIQEWQYLDDPLSLIRKSQQPAALRDGFLSGVALGGEWPADVINTVALRHPTVLFPQSVTGCRVDVVSMDNITTTQQIVTRLAELGHERIGFLGRCSPMIWANERFAGYVNALSCLGMAYRPGWVLDVDEVPMLNEGHEDYWRERVDRIESAYNNEGVEAWVCSSDWPAYQLYRGMADRGYKVPSDLSITGFDDTEAVRLGCPPVTSAKVPREIIGQAALKRLLNLIESPHSVSRHSSFDCELMLNGTTGEPSYTKNKIEDPAELAV